MCGISGFSGDFPEQLLERFVECLRHRGPDDRGTFFEPAARVGLAHTRLSILDLSPRGHQPMHDPESGCVITYNGELYNFRELRADLAERGQRFASDSDTEVLLRLYAVHGTDMLPLLDGIFAFGIWDPRDRSVFVARDHLGVKPLYVATPPAGVLFSSEIKALLAAPEVSRAVDVQAVDATLRHLWCPGPRTVLAGVRKLEPGCALTLRDGRVAREWRYFHFPVQEPWAGRQRDGRDPVAAMRAELERAVADQMVSDVPVGAFLSGGIDSSTVVAFAARHAEKIPCFTMRFTTGRTAAEGFDDDLPYARQVAAHLGVELVEVPVGAEVAGELEQMIYQLDEPQADVAPLNVRRIAEAARARGIKVLLSGAGGDDLFAGYRRHQAANLERWWSWLPAPARRALRDVTASLPQANAASRRIAKAFRHADLDRDERLVGYFEWIGGEERRCLFRPDVAAELAAGPAYDPLLESVRRLPPRTHPINRVLYLDGRYFLPDHNLNYTDKMAMAVGVEVRVPLLAVSMARFGASLPVRYKLRGRTGKWILREAARDLLPTSVLERSKTGFGVPLRTWLHGDLAPLLGDVLSAESLARGGLFDAAAVQRLVESDRAGRIDAAYPILAVVCVELWRRAFLEGGRTARAVCPAELRSTG
jgi:asparagine synthase (glutamine-hydrolysing)